MKTIKQILTESITINRFDTQECLTIESNVATELDDATADYLLNIRCCDQYGNQIFNFIEC